MSDTKKPYRLAELRKGKRWMIEYWCWHEEKEKLIRRQVRIPSSYKTDHQKRLWAKDAIKLINEELVQGKVYRTTPPKEENQPEENIEYTVEEAFNYAVKIKCKTLEEESITSYKNIVKIFLDFCKASNYSDKSISDLRRKDILSFLDYILTERNVNNNTRNDYLQKLLAVLSFLHEREIIETNPASGIKRLPKSAAKQYMPFTEKEIQLVLPALEKENEQLFIFSLTIYYCYVRPKELRLLKVKHFDLDHKRIFIPADISKNDKSESVLIPDALIPVLQRLDLSKYPDDYFVFGKSGKPYKTGFSKNYFSGKHRAVLRSLGIDNGSSLYSWKHTGVRAAYTAGFGVKYIQTQCRHSDITTTANYLRDLGLFYEDKLASVPDVLKQIKKPS